MNNNPKIPKRILLVIPILILGAVYILAGLIPINSLWGFNQLRYFPNYVAIIYAVLFLLITLPFVNKSAVAAIGNLSNKFQSQPMAIRIIVIAVLSGLIFYIFRVHVHSLGDGYQRIYQVEKGYWYYNTEPLDFFLHALLFRFLQLFGILSGELSYVIFSVASGIAFVLIVYLIKFPNDIPAENIVLIKLIAVSLGGMQMFCGYVESYTFFYLFALLFLFWAVRFLLSGKGLITASIFLALAMAAHITAGFLLPAFAYLAWFNLKKIRPKTFAHKYLAILIVILIILGHIGAEIRLKYFVDVYTPSFAAGILPLYSFSKYSILSPPHVYDILNQLLLIIPAAVILLIYFITGIRFDSSRKDLNQFLLIVILCALLVLALVDPKLGYARDWDLFSISAAAMGLSIVILLAIGLKTSGRLNRNSVFMIASLSILLLSGWILTNASAKRQLQRAEDLLGLSEKGRGYSTELLAYYYRMELGDSEKSLQLLESITGPAKNARVYSKIAKTQLDLHRDDAALKSASRGIALDSGNIELQLMAGYIWLKKGRPELALPRMLKANELAPGRPEVFHFLCNIYADLDSLGKAIMAGHAAIRLKPDFAPSYIELGEIFYRMHVYDSALVYTKAGLKLDPSISTGYQILEDIKKNYQQGGGR
jgi:tetratricopeptide (TPR) repeat protein